MTGSVTKNCYHLNKEAALRLWKASCSSFPHFQRIFLQSNWYKGEAILAKSRTNLRRKFALPRKDCSSGTWVGASASLKPLPSLLWVKFPQLK